MNFVFILIPTGSRATHWPAQEKRLELVSRRKTWYNHEMKFGAKAFVIYQKKILLILRDNKPSIPFPNMWNLPGGGIEENETHDQALKRELQEELGIMPRNILRMGIETFEDGKAVMRYLVRLEPDEVAKLRLGEGQEMRFFLFDDMSKLPLSPYLGNFIIRNKEYLKRIIEHNEKVIPERLGLIPD